MIVSEKKPLIFSGDDGLMNLQVVMMQRVSGAAFGPRSLFQSFPIERYAHGASPPGFITRT